MALHPIDSKPWHKGALGWALCQNAAKCQGNFAFPIALWGPLGAPEGKLRQQGGLWWWGALCAPESNESTPVPPPVWGQMTGGCPPVHPWHGRPAPRPVGHRALCCAGAPASRGALLAPAPEGAAWHRGLARAPGTACSAAALTPPGSGPARPRGSPRCCWGTAAPAPPWQRCLSLSLPLFCLPDHREAPGTHPEQGFPGGGDALSVPGTQVEPLHPPLRAQGVGWDRADAPDTQGPQPGCPLPHAPSPWPCGHRGASRGDIPWFAMTTGPRWPSWSRAEPLLLSGAVCGVGE